MLSKAFSSLLLLSGALTEAATHSPYDPKAQQVRLDEDQGSITLSDVLYSSNDHRPKQGGTPVASEYLEYAVQALDVMQSQFFQLWIGTWPTSIDWTGAVINTYVSALLGTLARVDDQKWEIRAYEVTHRYFSHNIAYYFGEDAFSIRNEAYDDMLWVVLGWLESIKFNRDRNARDATWHGTQFVPAFAHRARIFWEIASRGWDDELCGGGMTWNPNLTPYKNAITNQLFISASIGMYLYFPGDNNSFPYMSTFRTSDSQNDSSTLQGPFDLKYMKAAIQGYAWLKNSNMTNTQGLYVDGFHVRDWGLNGTNGSGKCDERNEIVYSYNQGVILSGLRGLWEATGDPAYLEDGYTLVRNVWNATGWTHSGRVASKAWSGLGRDGILEDLCDSGGGCSQDSQTFKGIFFQHLTEFCQPLPLQPIERGKTYAADAELAALHESNCLVIGEWVRRNAQAALETKDNQGKFGMWWGQQSRKSDSSTALPTGAKDYRNNPDMLDSRLWAGPGYKHNKLNRSPADPTIGKTTDLSSSKDRMGFFPNRKDEHDSNDRGRGRTVETQGGGIAVLRAAEELSSTRRRTR